MDKIPYSDLMQLGGLAVVAIGILYILYYFIKEHRSEMSANRKERIESYNWFQGYVNANNHEQTERFEKHTEALVEVSRKSTDAITAVSKNIEANTKIVEKHGELLERVLTEIRFFKPRE